MTLGDALFTIFIILTAPSWVPIVLMFTKFFLYDIPKILLEAVVETMKEISEECKKDKVTWVLLGVIFAIGLPLAIARML
jgi:hypothetical protein